MSFTGLTYSTSQQLNDRLRPFTYNQDLDLNFRTGSGAKNSFYSGHTSLVATSTFFLAKVYSDYHPNSKYKWVLFTTAGIATILTGHLRVRAGQHFPTDVLVGGIMGTAAGILTPHFHKNKLFKNENLSLLPITGEYHGLQLSLKF
jgi:membrane-associated phospholipid phosphatase